MKRKLLSAFLCAALILSLFSGTVSAAPSALDVSGLIDGILSYQCEKTGAETVQEWLDQGLSAEVEGSEWYVLALSQRDISYDFTAYLDALSALTSEKTIANAVTRQKYALTFLSGGVKNAFAEQTANDSVGKLGIMSVIFGLHMAENGLFCSMTAEEITDLLLSAQLADGGFALTGTVANPDVTAMAVQALAHQTERADVQTAMARAVDALASLLGEDGHYISYGVKNAESAAQAIMALLAAEVDLFSDERFLKNGKTLLDTLLEFRLENGAFSHALGGAADENATSQALLALVALERSAEGKTNFYDLDGAKNAVFKEEPAVSSEKKVDFRLIFTGIAALAALIGALILFLIGKRHPKNFMALLLALAVALALIWLVRLESAEDYYGSETQKGEIVGTVTMTIRCDAVAGQAEHIAADGVILPTVSFDIDADDTVYDILTEAVKKYEIQMDKSGADGFYYVSGMAYLYEFDFGDLSGWTYSVNGERASVGCDAYKLSDGDVIVWEYSLTLGKELS